MLLSGACGLVISKKFNLLSTELCIQDHLIYFALVFVACLYNPLSSRKQKIFRHRETNGGETSSLFPPPPPTSPPHPRPFEVWFSLYGHWSFSL